MWNHYYFVYVDRPQGIDERCPAGGVVVSCDKDATGSQVAMSAYQEADKRFPRRPWEMLALREVHRRIEKLQVMMMFLDRDDQQAKFEKFMNT